MGRGRQVDPNDPHEKLIPLNDPMVTAALRAHWGPAPSGIKRRKRMREALIAAAKAAQANKTS